MKLRSIVAGVSIFLSVGLVGALPVEAAAKGTPPKPIITVIRSTPAAKGKVNLTFVIAATDSIPILPFAPSTATFIS